MKIIRTQKHNQTFYNMMETDAGRAKMMELIGAHNEWLAQLKAEGKFIEGYFLPGSGGSVLIFEVENEAEIENLRLHDPLEITFDMDLRIAVTLSDHLNTVFAREE